MCKIYLGAKASQSCPSLRTQLKQQLHGILSSSQPVGRGPHWTPAHDAHGKFGSAARMTWLDSTKYMTNEHRVNWKIMTWIIDITTGLILTSL